MIFNLSMTMSDGLNMLFGPSGRCFQLNWAKFWSGGPVLTRHTHCSCKVRTTTFIRANCVSPENSSTARGSIVVELLEVEVVERSVLLLHPPAPVPVLGQAGHPDQGRHHRLVRDEGPLAPIWRRRVVTFIQFKCLLLEKSFATGWRVRKVRNCLGRTQDFPPAYRLML